MMASIGRRRLGITCTPLPVLKAASLSPAAIRGGSSLALCSASSLPSPQHRSIRVDVKTSRLSDLTRNQLQTSKAKTTTQFRREQQRSWTVLLLPVQLHLPGALLPRQKLFCIESGQSRIQLLGQTPATVLRQLSANRGNNTGAKHCSSSQVDIHSLKALGSLRILGERAESFGQYRTTKVLPQYTRRAKQDLSQVLSGTFRNTQVEEDHSATERELKQKHHCIHSVRGLWKAAGKGSESHTLGDVETLSARTQKELGEVLAEEMTKPDEVPELQSKLSATGGHDKPLVVGRTKPTDTTTSTMDASKESVAPPSATPAEAAEPGTPSKLTTKKEKAPKQPKAPKAAPPSAPLSPALIDLRVGHILRCVTHPNADSLFVSTIAMGDPEGADHTQVDEETGKIVRTVCSGLNGLVPLEEMQNRKIIVVANLKPVTMRGIKSAAMVLAASPKVAEGEDDHSPDRTVELVIPPAESEAGDKVFFEGWPYGDGKGPEKQLNPKKKVWEAIQPGFYTSEDLVVGFDAAASEVGGQEKGDLVVDGKGNCTVKTLKGAVVR